MLPLFDAPPEVDRAYLQRRLHELAQEGILFGGSSWKYEGWLRSIYTPDRYYTRGKFSKKRFDDTCLQEYAEVFPAVCGDFSYYNFPSPEFWSSLFGQAPKSLQFGFKVPEMITVATFPQHARYGARAGMDNPAFLDAGLFEAAFLDLLRPYQSQVGVIIIEFSTFPRRVFSDEQQFVAALDDFLGRLPEGFRYSVEIRNPEFFDLAYLECLRRHGVAHVYNSWTRMPGISDQMAVAESNTADFLVARALLRPGRSYEDAVKMFTPYERVQEENPAAREALLALIRTARQRRQLAYLFVNNRLEGNAPGTMQAVVQQDERH